MADASKAAPEVQRTLRSSLRQWGESPVPPTVLASMALAQAIRPVKYLQMMFPPVLLFSTYINILDFKEESAAITASWSGLYYVLSRRRKQTMTSKFSYKGIIRGTTQATCMMNVLGCGYVYVMKYGFWPYPKPQPNIED